MNVSLVTVCRNEFHRLESWYNRHSKLFDDIVVVDQSSTDETPSLQKKMNIISHDKVGWSELSREYACDLAKNDWILFLDIDENLVVGESFSFDNFIEDNNMCGYKIARDNFVGDRFKHTDNHYRFFNRHKSVFYAQIHTQIKPVNLKMSSDMNRDCFYVNHSKTLDEQNLDDARYMEFGCQHKR